MMDGCGFFTWPNGQLFRGYYEVDKKHGKGELVLADGTIVRGRWINGKLEGNSEVIQNGVIKRVLWRDGVQQS